MALIELYLQDDISVTLFADDTSLIISDKCSKNLEQKCNNNLSKLAQWFETNSLYLNSEKTNYIRFHNHQHRGNLDINIKINDSNISRAESTKFLGLNIDQHLNFKIHCKNLISKMNSCYYMFKNLKEVLTTQQLLNFYYAQVYSRLKYTICFWGMSPQANDVFICQKKIIRCIGGVSHRTSCRDLFKKFKILTLVSILIFELSTYIFKNYEELIRNSDIHDINTRSKDALRIPFARLKVSQKSPNTLGLKIFNKLPQHIKSHKVTHKFKKHLKQFLIEQTFYKLDDFFLSP